MYPWKGYAQNYKPKRENAVSICLYGKKINSAVMIEKNINFESAYKFKIGSFKYQQKIYDRKTSLPKQSCILYFRLFMSTITDDKCQLNKADILSGNDLNFSHANLRWLLLRFTPFRIQKDTCTHVGLL